MYQEYTDTVDTNGFNFTEFLEELEHTIDDREQEIG
jgi:hypothetical protein